jgi:hypothetical protein
MASVRQLITRALRIINYSAPGDSIPPEIINVGLEVLDGMIDSWSNNPLMVYSLDSYKFPVTAGQRDYTMGPGGDWDIARPMVINQAYVNWLDGSVNQTDLPVQILTDAQYASISVKNTPTVFAFALYSNGNYPETTVSLWPIPNQAGFMTLWLQQPLMTYDNIDEEVSYPPGYYDAFSYNLAVRLGMELSKQVPDTVVKLAISTMAEIARLNAVPQYQSGDGGLSSNKKRSFNYITGNFVVWNP